jgi:hypothetical protein
MASGRPSDETKPWTEYLLAVRRKIDIATYHRDTLDVLLASDSSPARHGMPPIPIQAHFEGVLFAFIAATDQLAEAIELGAGSGGNRRALDVVLTLLPDHSPWDDLGAWYASPIVRDIRSIRKRATHHHYRKTPGGFQLEVEPPAVATYDGPRTLREYTAAAVAHLGALSKIVSAVEERLGLGPSLTYAMKGNRPRRARLHRGVSGSR